MTPINIFQYLQDTKGKSIPLKFKLLHNLPLNEDKLIYNGYLDLRFSNIISLPNNLTINVNLDIRNTNILKLPNNLYVKGSLFLGHCQIFELPEDLYVKFDLYCRNTPLADNIKNDKTLLKKYHKQIKGTIYYGKH